MMLEEMTAYLTAYFNQDSCSSRLHYQQGEVPSPEERAQDARFHDGSSSKKSPRKVCVTLSGVFVERTKKHPCFHVAYYAVRKFDVQW